MRRAVTFHIEESGEKVGPSWAMLTDDDEPMSDLQRRARRVAEKEFGLGTNDKFHGPTASFGIYE